MDPPETGRIRFGGLSTSSSWLPPWLVWTRETSFLKKNDEKKKTWLRTSEQPVCSTCSSMNLR